MINAEKSTGAIKIILPRKFDVEEVAKFRNEAYGMLNNNEKDFIIDFSNCDFIDSTGIGVLVSVYKKCIERGGSYKLCSLNPEVAKIFQLTRLNKVFNIYPSFEAARGGN